MSELDEMYADYRALAVRENLPFLYHALTAIRNGHDPAYMLIEALIASERANAELTKRCIDLENNIVRPGV